MCPKLYRIQHRVRTPIVDAADGALVGCKASVGMTPDMIQRWGRKPKFDDNSSNTGQASSNLLPRTLKASLVAYI